jgi:hypothetical protein
MNEPSRETRGDRIYNFIKDPAKLYSWMAPIMATMSVLNYRLTDSIFFGVMAIAWLGLGAIAIFARIRSR